MTYIKKFSSGINRGKSKQSLWWVGTIKLVTVFLPLSENIAVSLVFVCVLWFFYSTSTVYIWYINAFNF